MKFPGTSICTHFSLWAVYPLGEPVTEETLQADHLSHAGFLATLMVAWSDSATWRDPVYVHMLYENRLMFFLDTFQNYEHKTSFSMN
jgi:hypothetical protein